MILEPTNKLRVKKVHHECRTILGKDRHTTTEIQQLWVSDAGYYQEWRPLPVVEETNPPIPTQ